MRDIALTVLIFGLLPFVITNPSLGILMWTWFGLMNPHRLTFGFAYSFSFAEVIGAVTIVAIVLSREPKKLPWNAPVAFLLALNAWMVVTTMFAIFPSDAWAQLEKVAKIQLFIFLTMVVMQSRERIKALVWVSAMSLGYFGIKGGIYTISHGGTGMVLGPDGGFISGNTEISLALTMTLPLMRWLQLHTAHRGLRWFLGISMALIVVAVLGSYSRGGFLAIVAMGTAFWLKGRRKMLLAVVLVMLVPAVLMFMPEAWWSRMETIQTYQQDTSATARLNSWGFGWNLARANPITGGGLQSFQKDAFALYAPDPTRVWDSHSIWVSILAEHGFVGLLLYIGMWASAWSLGARILARTRDIPELRWASDLAAMIQVSFIGFWVGGAFLSLAYWDYPYLLVAILVVTWVVVQKAGEPRAVEIVTMRARDPAGLPGDLGRSARPR